MIPTRSPHGEGEESVLSVTSRWGSSIESLTMLSQSAGGRKQVVAHEVHLRIVIRTAGGLTGNRKCNRFAKLAVLLAHCRVLDALVEMGIEDRTIICFMSDNGGLSTSEGSPTSNIPFRGGKGWIYEGGIREPYIIKSPGIQRPGSTSGFPVVSMDFYPTLLELAGLPLKPEQHLDGISLVPILKGKNAPKRDSLFWHYPHYSNQGGFPGGAIRAGDWKLIERYEDGQSRLYNIRHDLGETKDLANQYRLRQRQFQSPNH